MALEGDKVRTMKRAFDVLILIILSSELAVCLLCDSDADCFDEYQYCCSGYCKKSCNTTCLASSDCGSLGHLSEKCCNNKCVDIDALCPQINSSKTNLTSTHIAVLIVCVVLFVLVGVSALVMYVFKCGLFNRRRALPENPRPHQHRHRLWSAWRHRSILRCIRGDDDYLNAQMYTSTSESWVGKDFIQSSNPSYISRSTEFHAQSTHGP